MVLICLGILVFSVWPTAKGTPAAKDTLAVEELPPTEKTPIGQQTSSVRGTIAVREIPAPQAVNRIPDALIEPGEGSNRFIIVVEKATQKLFLYEYQVNQYYLVRSLDCTTGENIGDKWIEGDKKTPQGFYLFIRKSVESELAPIYGVLAYPMDYPNFWDRQTGKDGSGIWMHGLDRPRVPRDTNGCIALENFDIMNLEPFVHLYNVPIIIYDRISFADQKEIAHQAAKIKAFVETWRTAWESLDINAYSSKYSKDFISNDKKDYQAWMEHKQRLIQKYKTIKVGLSDLRIFRHNGVIVTLFNQSYKGDDSFASEGRKRLFLKEENGKLKIAAEVWRPFPPDPPRMILPDEVKQRVIAEKQGKTTVVAAASELVEPVTASPKRPVAAPRMKKTASTMAKPVLDTEKTPETLPLPEPEQTPVIDDEPAQEPVSQPVTLVASNTTAQQEIVPLVATTENMPVQSESEQVRQTVLDWLNAWRDMDVDQYITHYHPKFRYKDMDLDDFRTYKKDLKKKYKSISIAVDQMEIEVEGSKAYVTFIQDYRSDKYQDYGMKSLVFLKSNDNWRIREETWKDMSGGAKK